MNISLHDYKRLLPKLRSIERFQTTPHISKETVLEHHGIVAALVLKLHDVYDFNLEKALKVALLHDFTEIFTSDIPHNIKMSWPKETLEAFEATEYEYSKQYLGDEIADGLNAMNNGTTPEGLIVAYADAMDVELYAEFELNLGNAGRKDDVQNFAGIHAASKRRLVDLEKQLQPYLRKPLTC